MALHHRECPHQTEASVSKDSRLTEYYVLVDDDTDRRETLYTNYSVTPTADNTLSADEGFISVRLVLYFSNAGHSITIGGVRLRLGHHGLY
jgi:hypothetical protein